MSIKKKIPTSLLGTSNLNKSIIFNNFTFLQQINNLKT